MARIALPGIAFAVDEIAATRWMLGPEIADGGATLHLRLNLRSHGVLLFRDKDFEFATEQCTAARYGTCRRS